MKKSTQEIARRTCGRCTVAAIQYGGNGNNILIGEARWRWRMYAAQHWRDAANDAAALWRAAA